MRLRRSGRARRSPVVSVEPGADLVVGRIVVPAAELEWRYAASGGPGGQHANTSNTRVELRFDIAASPSLPPAVRDRLIERLGPVVSVVAADERSQWQNRRRALLRLQARLAEALVVRRRRVATKPTAGSRRRRLDAKRRDAQRKEARRPPTVDE